MMPDEQTPGPETTSLAAPAPAPPPSAPTAAALSSDWKWFIGIVVLAMAVRWLYVSDLKSASPFFTQEVGEARLFDEWARAINAGQAYTPDAYPRPPLYAWWLSAVYRVTGGSYYAARLIQCVLGALGCGLLLCIGRQLFDRQVGLFAGVAAAIYATGIYFDAELQPPALAAFLTLATITLLARASRGSAGAWLAAGTSTGLLILTQSELAPLVALVWLWMFLSRSSLGPPVRNAALYSIPVLLLVGAVAARNWSVAGGLVPISTAVDIDFYDGNQAAALGISPAGTGTEVHPRVRALGLERAAETTAGRELRWPEVASHYRGHGWRFITNEPRAAALLMLQKLHLFWGPFEPVVTKDLPWVAGHWSKLMGLLPVGFGLAGTLGALGVVLALRRARQTFPLWGVLLVVMLASLVLTVGAGRRLPAGYVLILLGIAAFCWLRDVLYDRRLPAFGAALVMLLGVGFVVNFIRPGVNTDSAGQWVERAAAMMSKGRVDEAERMLGRAVSVRWCDPNAHVALAGSFAARNRFADAALEFRFVLALDPTNVAALTDLAQIEELQIAAFANQGKQEEATQRLREAMALLGRAIEVAPPDRRPHERMARLFLMAGRPDEARKQWEAAVTAKPSDGMTLVGYGQFLGQSGEWNEGLRQFELAFERFKSDTRVRDTVLQTLLATGRYADVLRFARLRLQVESKDRTARQAMVSIRSAAPQDELRDAAEAIRIGEELVNDSSDHASLSGLATAYAEAGRFDEAIATLERAEVALNATELPDRESRKAQIQSRREQFRQRKPYRLPLPTTRPATPPTSGPSTAPTAP